MYLKAIDENNIDDKEYVLATVRDNFLKLLNDGIKLNKDNSIGNLIMSICLNRLVVARFKKLAFKNNQKEIERYFTDASLYRIKDKKNDDTNSCYLIHNKNNIELPLKYEKREFL